MNKLFETAKEIDRILKSGIEIHPNSPIHEKLQQALNIPLVIKSGSYYDNGKCKIKGKCKYKPYHDGDCYDCSKVI
jgi:hypothetical protein